MTLRTHSGVVEKELKKSVHERLICIHASINMREICNVYIFLWLKYVYITYFSQRNKL